MAKPTENAKLEANKVFGKQPDIPVQVLRGGRKPSDETRELKDWQIPAGYNDCWVDVYEGPLGRGFVVNYEIVKGSETWIRSENFGPERWRTSDWTLVPEEKELAKRID